MKLIAYEHRDVEEVIRFLETCPYGQVARHLEKLARGGIEVDVVVPQQSPAQAPPGEDKP